MVIGDYNSDIEKRPSNEDPAEAFDDSYYDAQSGLFPCKALNNDENEFSETEKLVNNEIVLTEVDDYSCAV